ncbi:hypothetical protein ACGFNU_21355 [Spirillospora sp. NPDC048911]|uniref:hypothetical protein n=1 Tax=Spirillospora sp. NPDC048911 TaxID=3364527 RepID=UPI00371BFCF8
MADTNPTGEARPGTQRLMEYWAHGAGAKVINWGVAGDFDRCVIAITKAVDGKLSERAIKGLCSNLHVRALGVRPGQERDAKGNG